MPYYGYRKRPVYRKKRTYKKRAASKSSGASIAKIAKQVVHRMTENKKMTPLVGLDLSVVTTLDDPLTQCVNISPLLNQGPEQGERIGNSVRVMKSKLILQLSANQVTQSGPNPGPNYFDIYVYKSRLSNFTSDVPLTQFLQFGSTAIPYNGGLAPYSGLLNVNSDLFNLKCHKRVKLWNPAPSNANDSYPDYASATNAVSGMNVVIDTTKFLNKLQRYNDNTSLPTNDNLFFSVVHTQVDGGDSGTTRVGKFTFVHQMTFEDR